MKRQRYAWVAAVPAAWLLICTVSAGLLKLFSPDPAIGFLAQAARYRQALDAGRLLAPAQTSAQMQRIITNGWVNSVLTALFLFVVLSVLFYGLRVARRALTEPRRSDHEIHLQTQAQN